MTLQSASATEEAHYMIRLPATISIAALLLPAVSLANGPGENVAWQFQSTAEAANRAYLEEMRLKREGGFYNAPQYNTFIDTQNNFNCSNSANSSGNGNTSSAVANTPNATGANGNATGNQNSSSVGNSETPYRAVLNSGQDNWGPVISDVLGDTFSSASGNATRQALNSNQENFGRQLATIVGSNACSFPGGVGPGAGR
jgi:hypothetical protein